MAALRGAMTALRSLPRVATGALGGMAWGAATRGGGGMAQAHVARLSIGGMGSSQRDAASGREWSHGLRQPGGVSVASVVGHALAGSGLQFSPAALRGFTTSLPARQDAAAAVMEKEAEKPVINTLTNPAHNAEHHDFPRARSLKRKFKTSVKKLMMVCKLVRRARVDAALMQLTLSPKRAARTVRQLIYDAKFNASNNHGAYPAPTSNQSHTPADRIRQASPRGDPEQWSVRV